MNAIKLSSAGIARALATPGVTAQVGSAASSVASNAQGETAGGAAIPVRVRQRETVGARHVPVTAFDVQLAHPAGLAVQAKRGTLTRAATQAGLTVTDRGAV